MNVDAPKWFLAFVLPNLSLDKPIDTEFVAIASSNDQRVLDLRASYKSCAALTNNFTDQFSSKVSPSVLLCSVEAPDNTKKEEALVGFRNVVALSSIINGWATKLGGAGTPKPLWSEYFDIYPIYPGEDDTLVTRSTAGILGLDKFNKFRGQTSPNLRWPIEVSHELDKGLRELLLRQWNRRFVSGKEEERKTRALFRSLEVAFQASTTPSYNNASLFDYGTNLGLWVSAIEILAHPYKEKVNLGKVIDMLGKYQWNFKKLRSKCYVFKYNNIKRRVCLIQRLYQELYKARNDFFHGNALSNKIMYPFKDNRKLSLLGLAPLIYRTVLIVYLSELTSKGVKSRRYDGIGNILIERALTKLVDKNDPQRLLASRFPLPRE